MVNIIRICIVDCKLLKVSLQLAYNYVHIFSSSHYTNSHNYNCLLSYTYWSYCKKIYLNSYNHIIAIQIIIIAYSIIIIKDTFIITFILFFYIES